MLSAFWKAPSTFMQVSRPGEGGARGPAGLSSLQYPRPCAHPQPVSPRCPSCTAKHDLSVTWLLPGQTHPSLPSINTWCPLQERGQEKPFVRTNRHSRSGSRLESMHFLEELSDSAKPHSAPHVWFAVIRPAEQPALKMPFNEKRPIQPPWHLQGVVWQHLTLPGTTALSSASRFSLRFQLTANLTADPDGY